MLLFPYRKEHVNTVHVTPYPRTDERAGMTKNGITIKRNRYGVKFIASSLSHNDGFRVNGVYNHLVKPDISVHACWRT